MRLVGRSLMPTQGGVIALELAQIAPYLEVAQRLEAGERGCSNAASDALDQRDSMTGLALVGDRFRKARHIPPAQVTTYAFELRTRGSPPTRTEPTMGEALILRTVTALSLTSSSDPENRWVGG